MQNTNKLTPLPQYRSLNTVVRNDDSPDSTYSYHKLKRKWSIPQELVNYYLHSSNHNARTNVEITTYKMFQTKRNKTFLKQQFSRSLTERFPKSFDFGSSLNPNNFDFGSSVNQDGPENIKKMSDTIDRFVEKHAASVTQRTVEKYKSSSKNLLEELHAVNNKFLKEYMPLLIEEFNNTSDMSEHKNIYDYGEKTILSREFNRKQRDNEIYADDYQFLDLYRKQNVQKINSQFRYGNKIPLWQRSMNRRNYERDIDENLRNSGDREQFTYGYNLSEIKRKSVYNKYFKQIPERQPSNKYEYPWWRSQGESVNAR